MPVGLDIVEIFMQAEETFGIEIDNDDAGSASTVGDLYNLVLKELEKKNGKKAEDPEAVWRKLRRLIVEQLQVDEEDVVPEAHFGRDLGAD
jgi:acyl carrier protein